MKYSLTKELFGYSLRDKNCPDWIKKADRSYWAQHGRCNNPKVACFKSYGAMGIRVEYSKIDFLKWYKSSFNKKFQKLHKAGVQIQVGRIDHSKNYSLSNIKLETAASNSADRIKRNGCPIPRVRCLKIDRKNGKILAVYKSLLAASKKEGVTPQAILHRVKIGKGAILQGSKFKTPSKIYFVGQPCTQN